MGSSPPPIRPEPTLAILYDPTEPPNHPGASRHPLSSEGKATVLPAHRQLNSRNRSGTIAKLVTLDSNLLKQGQVEICDRRALRQHDMLTAELHFAVAATNQDVRLRVIVVPIAVAHVRSVHEDRVIEQRSLSVGYFRHLLHER